MPLPELATIQDIHAEMGKLVLRIEHELNADTHFAAAQEYLHLAQKHMTAVADELTAAAERKV